MRAGRSVLPHTWLIVVVLAACAQSESPRASGSASPPTPDVEAAFRAHLGQTWELEHLGDQRLPAADSGARAEAGGHAGAGGRPTLRFTDARPPEGSVHPPGTFLAGGRSFCNAYGTAYELGPGGAFRFRGFESTLVGCDGPDSLETRFFRGLNETRRVELDATRLELVTEKGSRLIFVPSAESADSAPR